MKFLFYFRSVWDFPDPSSDTSSIGTQQAPSSLIRVRVRVRPVCSKSEERASLVPINIRSFVGCEIVLWSCEEILRRSVV